MGVNLKNVLKSSDIHKVLPLVSVSTKYFQGVSDAL